MKIHSGDFIIDEKNARYYRDLVEEAMAHQQSHVRFRFEPPPAERTWAFDFCLVLVIGFLFGVGFTVTIGMVMP